MPIHFFSEDSPFKLSDESKHELWVIKSIKQEGAKLDELSYIFCSDTFLLGLNQSYLNHNTYTDVITFDHSGNPEIIAGEVYISVDRVKENAQSLNQEFIDELNRVMIHGVLHLLGYSDKTTEDQQYMRKKEDHYLSLRSF